MLDPQEKGNFALCVVIGLIKSVNILMASVRYVVKELSGGGCIVLLLVEELGIVQRLKDYLLNYAYIVGKSLSLNKVTLNFVLMIVVWLIDVSSLFARGVKSAVSLSVGGVGSIVPINVWGRHIISVIWGRIIQTGEVVQHLIMELTGIILGKGFLRGIIGRADYVGDKAT
jgi:hypothetical protein